MSASRETFPFESGAMVYFFFRRASPATEAGHGFKRCQTRFQWSFSSSVSPAMPNSFSSSSSSMRCRASSLVQGSSPLRTRSMAGRYPSRNWSAKRAQSTFTPLALPQASPSAMMDRRQSTTVPNVSKIRALTDPATAAVARPATCPRISGIIDAAAPAPNKHANRLRLQFMLPPLQEDTLSHSAASSGLVGETTLLGPCPPNSILFGTTNALQDRRAQHQPRTL